MGISKMVSYKVMFAFWACVVMVNAVSPMTAEELQHIRDFTAKAHMKRLQAYPDQIMTPSTHYLGRRLPPGADKQPSLYMQVPEKSNGGVKQAQQGFTVELQPASAVQNYVLNYTPIPPNSIPQNGPIYQGPRPQHYPFLQNAPNGVPLRGPPPPPPPQFGKRPSFFSLPDAAPPSSLLQFFFPKRPIRRPPSYRPPVRFEYGQGPPPPPPLYQHHQNLHNVMAQQHLLSVQQAQAQAQGQGATQPSASPATVQSTTIKSVGQGSSTVGPSPSTGVAASVPSIITQGAPPHLNHFHKDVPFFGKPFGKPYPHHKIPHMTSYVPQNRPGDGQNYIQKYVGPQDYQFLPLGPHVPSVHTGPNNNRYQTPVSFSHIEQMPFPLQPQSLPVHMVVQSQEFPNYQFSTTFTATSSENPLPINPSGSPSAVYQDTTIKIPAGPPPPTVHVSIESTPITHVEQSTPIQPAVIRQPQESQSPYRQPQESQSSYRQHQRVKKIRPRPTTTSTTTLPPPPTSSSLGDIIFESSKETREFHDSARIATPPHRVYKHRQPKPQLQLEPGTLQKESVESTVVLAPLVFAEETSTPLTQSTSTFPSSSTAVSVTTEITTTPVPFRAKITKAKDREFHKSKLIHEKRVTASGAGLSAVTVEPLRLTSTGRSTTQSLSTSSRNTNTPGRVVTTSVTSRVVSSGPNPQKRFRLRKVKLPNPDAKVKASTTTTTTNFPTSTTSSRIPSKSTTYSTTEGSLTTLA